MVDVFISYARESQVHAQRVAEGVAREGYSVWWDQDLPPHLSYGDVITEKIGVAKAVIVIWSAAAAESEWVRAEADLARGQKKLIQTSVDGRLPPMPFNQIQFATIGDWQGEPDHSGWRKVRASLAALCGGDQPTTAPTAPAATARTWRGDTASVPPPSRGSGARMLPIALGAAVFLVAAAGGGWYLLRGGDEVEARSGDGASVEREREDSSPQEEVTAGSAPRPATALFTQAAVIDDPDGYTNVRSGPSANFPIVARIDQGEVFTTYTQPGDWWQVRTADSRVGFMARSRIRIIDAQAAAGAQGPGLADAALAAPAAIPAGGSDPAQIFPDSSQRRLQPGELAGLSSDQLRLARNEIFARNGHSFQDAALRRHFERYSWYRPRSGSVSLSPVEQANVELLRQAEAK